MISVKKLRFSSCPTAKVSRQGPQRTALEHSLGYNEQSCPSCVFLCVLKVSYPWEHLEEGCSILDIYFYIQVCGLSTTPPSAFKALFGTGKTLPFSTPCGMHTLNIISVHMLTLFN